MTSLSAVSFTKGLLRLALLPRLVGSREVLPVHTVCGSVPVCSLVLRSQANDSFLHWGSLGNVETSCPKFLSIFELGAARERSKLC